MQRITFSKQDSLHLLELTLEHFQDSCVECEDIKKRLIDFNGKKDTAWVKRVIKKSPYCESKEFKKMNNTQRKTARNTMDMKCCRYCRSTENLTIDHKIPTVQGGTNKLGNLQCLCKRCNTLKSGMSDKQVKLLWKWLMEVQEARIADGKKPYFYNKPCNT